MKLTFKKNDLARAAGVVESIVNVQTSLPILANVLIQAKGDKVWLIASDLETCVRCEAAAEIHKEGAVTVPALTLSRIVHELPEAEVHLALKQKNVSLDCNTVHYDLSTLPPEDFPEWPEFKAITAFSVLQKEFRKLIEKIAFAIPQRDPRKVLLGGLLELKQKLLKCVATDGKRLGYVQYDLEEISGEQETSAIIPHKPLAELQKRLGEEGTVSVSLGERQISFEFDGVVYYTNRIEGSYPNYSLVIPKEFTSEARIDRESFAANIRRAAVISEEKMRSIVLTVRPDEMLLSATSYDLGSFESVLPVNYSGNEFKVAFNYRFLLDVLKVIESKEVRMKVKEPEAPVVFEGVDEKNAFFLVMPIKLAEFSEEEEGAAEGESEDEEA
jgi:DNA polymerase-3 subunit beta